VVNGCSDRVGRIGRHVDGPKPDVAVGPNENDSFRANFSKCNPIIGRIESISPRADPHGSDRHAGVGGNLRYRIPPLLR
jgi:hypothetical protein